MNTRLVILLLIVLLIGPMSFQSCRPDNENEFKFLVTGDPQYKFDELDPDRSSAINADYIASKMEAKIATGGYKGLIIAGDLTHFARKDEMDRYLKSIEGFKSYVFDGIGNHDFNYPENEATNFEGVEAFGLAEIIPDQKRGWNNNTFDVWEEVRSRNRVTPVNASYPNIHYSWDWGEIHFVHLNLFPGDQPVSKWTVHNPLRSLSFLETDLKDHVGDSGRPVILIHHYGFDDFSLGIDEEGKFNPKGQWWTAEQRKAYWDVIEPYNVVVIFSGHAHFCRPVCYLPWDGENIGEDLVMPDHIPSFIAGAAREGYFLECRIAGNKLNVKRFKREELLLEKTIPLDRSRSDYSQ